MSTGIFNTSQLTQDLAKLSFSSMITRLMPNGQAPLFGLTSMLKEETAVQTEHGFFAKTMIFPSVVLSANVAAADTIWPVVSTANMLPGMILQVPTTLENVMVIGINSAVSVSVQRAVGNVSAQAATSTTPVFQVANAYEESSLRPQALTINPVRITNLTQIFRNTWAISGSVAATQVIAGDSTMAENKTDCAQFHATNIESALFFGQKQASTRNGQPFRTMDGVISIVSNLAYYPSSYSVPNVYAASATTNYTQLSNFLEPSLNQTTDPKVANERVVFVGGTAKRVLTDIGRLNGTYYIVDGQTSYGLQFSTFKTARGTFRMIEHPLFNSNSVWSKMAVSLDMSSFNVAYLGGRKTQYKGFNEKGDTAQDNGIDAEGGTLTTEMTCLVKNPPANAVITNLTAGAAG